MNKTCFSNLSRRLLVLLLFCSMVLGGQARELKACLDTLSSLSEVKAMPSSVFPERYVFYIRQYLDPHHPEKGEFRQRVILSHVGFDRPMVLVTEGYDGHYADSPTYREELSKWYNTNQLVVQYRYFSESTPEKKDWRYLTAENSAFDLHHITETFRKLYTGKWIATGISKGGQTALLYRTFFPHDVDITVPYVGPLCRAVEDGRHEPYIENVSGTPEGRTRVREFQTAVMKRKKELLPLFSDYCKKKNYRFKASVADIYDYDVMEYSFAFWQWGSNVADIPASDAPADVMMQHLLRVCDPDYFAYPSSTLSFFVQAAKELGYYGYDTRPFRQWQSIKTSKDYLRRLMLPDELRHIKFDDTLYKKINHFLRSSDEKILFVYGHDDPWSSARPVIPDGKKNMHVFIQDGGCHLARIATLSSSQQQEARHILDEWLKQ